MTELHAFGDSLSSGFTPSEDLYLARIADHFGYTLVNHAVGGSQAADQSFLCYDITPSADNVYSVLIGINDVYTYGTDTTKRTEGFIPFHRALVAWNALPDKVFARDMDTAGTWTNTGFNSIGCFMPSPSPGGAKACHVSGDAIYVFGAIHNYATSEGKVDIKVDGTIIGSIETKGTLVDNTSLGRNVSLGCWSFRGFGAGSHLVQTVQSNTKTFFLDAVAGSDQATKPYVYVGDISRRHPLANYDATTGLYNASILTTLHELRGDGLNVAPFYVNRNIDPVLDISKDGVHPNDSGQDRIYSSLLAAMS